MEQMGSHLKLAKHPVYERSTGKVKTMIGPVDVKKQKKKKKMDF